jgi:hypothetical protein
VVHIETIVLFTINYYREQDQASEGATRTTWRGNQTVCACHHLQNIRVREVAAWARRIEFHYIQCLLCKSVLRKSYRSEAGGHSNQA